MRELRFAIRNTIPIFFTYLFIGIAFGVLTVDAGYSVLFSIASAFFIFAGSMQLVMIPMMTSGASLITLALMTFFINARHIFYGISFVERFRKMGWRGVYMIFALTDETYSLLCDGKTPEGSDPNAYRFFVSLFNHSYWVTGSILGSLLGAVLPFSTAGIEFSMTALFIAAFTEQWLTTRDHIPALTGLLSTLLCLILFGPERFLIPAMLLITLVLTILRSREEAKQ